MINIESNTLFIKGKSYEQVVSEVMDFFDLEGKNVLYITDSKVEDTRLFQFLRCNKVTFTGSDYKEVIKSNLYNVDIILVTSTSWMLLPVKEYIDKLKVTGIYIQSPQPNSPDYKPSKIDFDNIYEMYVKDSGPRTINDILLDKNRNIVKDIKNDWELSTSELKVKYIRDKKIGDILD
jgi:hypothetical protein